MWYVLLIAIGAELYSVNSIHSSVELCEQQQQRIEQASVCVQARVRVEWDF